MKTFALIFTILAALVVFGFVCVALCKGLEDPNKNNPDYYENEDGEMIPRNKTKI